MMSIAYLLFVGQRGRRIKYHDISLKVLSIIFITSVVCIIIYSLQIKKNNYFKRLMKSCLLA